MKLLKVATALALLAAAAALVLYASKLAAQDPNRISVQCMNGICPVPEPVLLRLVQAYSEADQYARLCGKVVR